MFKLDTLIDVIALVAASKRQRAVLWQDASGNWLPLSSDDLVARVYTLANAFRAWGILKGDRIAILSENRWEWPVVDFATLVLGAVDVPDRLLIPEKLYGREHEIGTLVDAFDRVVANGATELVLVSGYSGIGKTSVVNELHKALVPPRGRRHRLASTPRGNSGNPKSVRADFGWPRVRTAFTLFVASTST